VDAGLFHDFHPRWAVALSSSLNAGRLPPDYYALVEQNFRGPIPDGLTLVSYDAGPECVAYVESIGVGNSLPEMPLFLRPGFYVPAPLNETYQTAWATFPDALKGMLNRIEGESA